MYTRCHDVRDVGTWWKCNISRAANAGREMRLSLGENVKAPTSWRKRLTRFVASEEFGLTNRELIASEYKFRDTRCVWLWKKREKDSHLRWDTHTCLLSKWIPPGGEVDRALMVRHWIWSIQHYRLWDARILSFFWNSQCLCLTRLVREGPISQWLALLARIHISRLRQGDQRFAMRYMPPYNPLNAPILRAHRDTRDSQKASIVIGTSWQRQLADVTIDARPLNILQWQKMKRCSKRNCLTRFWFLTISKIHSFNLDLSPLMSYIVKRDSQGANHCNVHHPSRYSTLFLRTIHHP